MKQLSVTKLSYFVIGYMLLAFAWWALHLWHQNDRAFDREKRLITLQIADKTARSEAYRLAEKSWISGRRMVVAEGVFFTACLAWGLWVIRRSAAREVSLARQRRNFLLSITHELKSPIAAMRLVFETLSRRALSPEKSAPLLANGLKDADRLQNLVESMLLAARLEDNWRPATELLDFVQIARESVESLKVRFPNANMAVDFTQEHIGVQADRLGLTAVVHNLLENALKYAPEGTLVLLRAAQKDGHLHFSVADRGPGIPDNEKQTVFEKFYRMGNEDTRETTGTGLGLYIVSQVVKAHRGHIRILDNKPQGAIFEVKI